MKTEFSETQFAYGVTREIEDNIIWSNVGVPRFPTLRDEAELGYDVSFDRGIYPIFLQYKVPKFLSRGNAKHWEIFNRPFYRFNIYGNKISNQHQRLYELSMVHEKTYYCSPAFHTYDEYCEYHRNRKIAENSIFVPLSSIGEILDNQDHTVIYNINPNEYYFCSKAKKINAYRGKEILLKPSVEKYPSIGVLSKKLYSELISLKEFDEFVLSKSRNNILFEQNWNIYLKMIGEFLMVKYNVELLVIQDRN